jgi:6-pyruvoyltetrahydropterin/6-carboxytetrahydropterin synthase
MLQLTKIFRFEMAHAIFGYAGACKNIHGHSYELHVTVFPDEVDKDYIPAPGFILDFKELKKLVTSSVIETFDHKLVLSRDYLAKNPPIHEQENLVIWEAEPTAENMLIYIQRTLSAKLPATVKLAELKLYETINSYVRWINTNTPR